MNGRRKNNTSQKIKRDINKIPALKASKTDTFSYALLEITRWLGKKFNLKGIIDKILGLILKELKVENGSILLVENNGERLKIISAKGLPKEVIRKGYVDEKDSISFWVMKNRRPLILQGKVRDKRFRTIIDKRRIKSALSVPLRAEDKIIGVINVSRNSGKRFVQQDLNKLIILAGQAVMAIENARLYAENLRTMRLATIGEVVSGISHDVRTILTGIKCGLWLATESIKAQNYEALRKNLELLQRNIERLTLMTLDMLDFLRKRKPAINECNLASMIEEALGTVRLMKQYKKYAEQVAVSKDLEKVFLDRERIFRCLVNLLNNAVEALPDGGGVIKINGKKVDYSPGEVFMTHRWGRAKKLIVLEISDNGHGIKKEEVGKIFEPFFSKQPRGTGLGLTVSKKIIEEHKGRITVESEVGKGTTFRLLIPEY